MVTKSDSRAYGEYHENYNTPKLNLNHGKSIQVHSDYQRLTFSQFSKKQERSMATPSTSIFPRDFQLPSGILGPGSVEKVSVTLTTDADVLQAIVGDSVFPARPNGRIELGSVVLEASGGGQVSFNAGQGTVGFDFSASFKTGVGVYDQPADAIGSLQLDAPPNLDLAIPNIAGSRYLLMLLGYSASGSFSGSHPIGLLGTVSFGAQATGDAVYAVLHRIAAGTGAATALGDTISSWRLPRHVTAAEDLRPGTWILAQADGSIALQLAAQLGYDFNFVRQAHLLGITRELGAKIDAGLKVSLGFSASGRYVVVLGRETDASTVRLRLFKQSDQGFAFGLNLTVGVTAKDDLPPNLDDFVKSIFGVHGLQVLKDLHLIEQWTDPTKDLGETAARLLNDEGLTLLTRATGIDARAEFNKARQIVLDEFQKWDALPDRASALLWRILGQAGPVAVNDFQTFLAALADPNPDTRRQTLDQAISQTAFGDTPQGQFLESIADQGLLALTMQLDRVQPIAAKTLDILQGGVIKKIQDFINEKLDLNKVRAVFTQNDFDTLDGWLVKRLGDFLDKALDLAALKEIQTAINLVIQKASDFYANAVKALNNRYSLDIAASYQRNTTKTALLDVNFDLSLPTASLLLQEVVGKSQLDNLLVNTTAGVTLNAASLTHEIKRNTDVQLHMPFFDSDVQHVNDSLAALTVEHDSGRVLAYQLSATDTVTSKNRFMSQLSLLGKLKVVNGQIQMAPDTDQAVAYQSRQVKSSASLVELEFRTRAFLQAMLGTVFTDGASLDRFYLALDQTISKLTGNRNNDFGDIALNLQTALPATVLEAWFQPRNTSGVKNASMLMSRALQARLKALIPSFFFENLDNLQPNASAAALLVWSALPVSTSIDFQDGEIQRFNTDTDIFWDFQDGSLRKAVAFDAHTSRSLATALATARERLLNAGKGGAASFFTADQANSFLNLATNSTGDIFLHSLLFTEAEMVNGAAKTLKDIQSMLSTAATAPTQAIALFADYGAHLSETFNKSLSVYGNESLRTLNSMLFVEASKAIDLGFAAEPAVALVTMLVLTKQHTFQLSDYLSGNIPPREQVALAQTLTNLS
jgi:hypothetical protein